MRCLAKIALLGSLLAIASLAAGAREISGIVMTAQRQVVSHAAIVAQFPDGRRIEAESNSNGQFRLAIPDHVPALVVVSGRFLYSKPVRVDAEAGEPLVIEVGYRIAPVHQSLVISSEVPDPAVEDKDDTVFSKTRFGRDDQIFQVLDAGINAGQHEGGGKSVEIRRFGFNLDHGGVSGGLRVLVDDVQQNQSTQGHGQGYLGELKSLSPELVQEVQIVNGPFRAE
jgi:hypothetical protein